MEIFQDMEGLLLKSVKFHVEIQDMEIFQDMEVKHHTPYRTTIGKRKTLFHR